MKTKRKTHKYGACEYCGGAVVEREPTVNRRINGKLQVFENVPVGVCQQCGNRVFKGPVLMRMLRLAKSKRRVKRVLRVPVREYLTA
jgi:YgiT-type zinc finger domain-containing protein